MAFWGNGCLTENFQYKIAGTSCEPVVKEAQLKFYPHQVQKSFPQASGLAAMGAVCYLGINQ